MSKIYHFSSSKRLGWLKLFPFSSNTLCWLLIDSVINWIHSSNIARKIMPVADKCTCFRQKSSGCYCFSQLLSYHGGLSINWSRFFLCRCQTTLLLFFPIKIQIGISRTTFLLFAQPHWDFAKFSLVRFLQAGGEFSLSQSLALLWKNPHPTMYLGEFENRLVSAGKTKTFSPTMLNLYQVELDYTNWFCTFS